MLDILFYLLINALFFLGIVAVAFLLFLPLVKLLQPREEDAEQGKGCVNC